MMCPCAFFGIKRGRDDDDSMARRDMHVNFVEWQKTIIPSNIIYTVVTFGLNIMKCIYLHSII